MSDTCDTSDKNKKQGDCCCNCDYSMAFLVLRFWLAIRAIVTGIEKYGAYKSIQRPLLDASGQPDASGAMIDVKVKFYSMANYSGIPAGLKGKFANEVMIPGYAMNIYDKMLGPALLILGFTLLVGLGTRISLFLQGLLYVSLTVGLILIHQDDGVAWLGIHMALVALALMLAKYNKFTLLKKW